MKKITVDFFKPVQLFALVLSCSNLYAFDMRCVAHRGIHDSLPENTAEAIKLAYDSGATWVETDFHSTKSGLYVCIHCEKVLAALSGCKKKIADLCEGDLAQIDLGKSGKYDRAYRIPLMQDILKLVPKDRILQAEIKGYSPAYADGIRAAGYEFRVWGVNKRSTLMKAVELGATGFATNHYFDMLKLGGEIKGVKVLP